MSRLVCFSVWYLCYHYHYLSWKLLLLPPGVNIVAANVAPTTNVAAMKIAATDESCSCVVHYYYSQYNVICIFDLRKLLLIYLIAFSADFSCIAIKYIK